MPSDDLLYEFQDHLKIIAHWRLSGSHYQKTAEAWLSRLDTRRGVIWPVLAGTYGERNARRWWVRWRTFFMTCAELWGCHGGEEWIVSHYALEKPPQTWDHRDD
jgi:cyclopropane-fatty-acyl-phospholipid synthase